MPSDLLSLATASSAKCSCSSPSWATGPVNGPSIAIVALQLLPDPPAALELALAAALALELAELLDDELLPQPAATSAVSAAAANVSRTFIRSLLLLCQCVDLELDPPCRARPLRRRRPVEPRRPGARRLRRTRASRTGRRPPPASPPDERRPPPASASRPCSPGSARCGPAAGCRSRPPPATSARRSETRPRPPARG